MLSVLAQLVCRLAVCCACVGVITGVHQASAALGLAPGTRVAAAAPLSAPASGPAPAPAQALGVQVADLARQYVGSRYVWGGSSPAGFDCSGFVMWVYAQFGVDLPHDEAGQLASGRRVDADELQPGDVLVFANTYRRGLSHVGIYLGDDRFVHAVDERHGVLVSALSDDYWAQRLVGASRTLGVG